MNTTNQAAVWLQKTRAEHRLSLRDLARAVSQETGKKISHTTISDAEKGSASFETWAALAEYFRTPIQTVLEMAGYLNPLPGKDNLIEQIEMDLRAMSPAARKTAAKIIRSMLDK